MEENKNQAPVAGKDAKRRHRPRHHHGKGGDKNQNPVVSGAPKERATEGQKQNNGRPSGSGGRHNRRHGRGREESRLYSPYELSKSEQELKDLRAQIVVQPAKENEATIPLVEEPAPVLSLDTEPDTTLLDEFERREAEKETVEETVEVIGVRFRSVGKVYYFDPGDKKIPAGQFAIVETARGPEFGEVVLGNAKVAKSRIVSPLRPLLRVATKEDIAHNEENAKKEAEALEICRAKIAKHELEMKLIDVQYAFDNSKLLFYFSSEGRVDFRELVKDLASTFHTRIELRQIGIRDEAKLLGGIGACGRLLCCSTFLPDFAQVSIKMAKEQNLSLNSTKISGVCGRLMCCLRYESDTYAEEIRKTPPVDATVETPDGVGRVVSSAPLSGKLKVLLSGSEDAPPKDYHRDQVTVLSTDKRKGREQKPAEEKENAQGE